MIRIFTGTKSDPLENAYVSFELIVGDSEHLPFGRTDAKGIADLKGSLPPPSDALQIFVAAPDHQTLIIPHTSATYEIVLPRIEVPADHLGWWHHRCGIKEPSKLDGRSIKIGMIDSGCHRTATLRHVKDLGTISMKGYDPTDTGVDDEHHGTSVAAIITGRPGKSKQFAGFAPRSELHSLRVTFGLDPAESNQMLIADALEMLLEKKLHLINCSFAFVHNHEDVQRYLGAACQGGTLIICAARNHVPVVGFPARSPNTVSVSALGELNQFHHQSDSALTLPESNAPLRWDRPLFIPKFVPFQGKVDCIAPGVGVVALEPPHSKLPMGNRQESGTSFACPIVTGLLATALSQDQHYLNLGPTHARTVHARHKLEALCRRLRLNDDLQGDGLPQLA